MTYPVGLIGLSQVGEWHRNAYETVDDTEVVAVADVDADVLTDRGESWSVPPDRRYRDHAALLEAEDLDAVSVATPSFLHRDHVVDAVESAASPDVIWVEKPIATSVTDADEMVDTCADAGVELVVNHARRFGSGYRQLKTFVREGGLIGDVRSINVSGPEELLRNGTHSVDLANFLLESPYQWGFGYLTGATGPMGEGFDDRGGAGVTATADGAYVHFDCTVPRGVNDGSWTIVGTDGKLYVDTERDVCRYWRLEESASAPYDVGHVETDLPASVAGLDDHQELFRNGARHVAALLEGSVENQSPGEDARHVLETIVAFFIAHYTGSVVELPLDRPLRDVRIRSH